MCTDDEIVIAEIGGRQVLMSRVEYEGYCHDLEAYGTAAVDVNELGYGRWIPQADMADARRP